MSELFYPKRKQRKDVIEKIRERYEPNEYYQVRAKIMAECYVKGWNPKEIVGYFKMNAQQFYKFCDIKTLKLERMQKELGI